MQPLQFSGRIETEKYSSECEKANGKFIETYLEEQAFKITDFIIRSEFQRDQIMFGLVENPFEAKLTPDTIIPDDEFEQFKNDFFSRHKNIFSSIRYPYVLTEELFDSPGQEIEIQDKFLYDASESRPEPREESRPEPRPEPKSREEARAETKEEDYSDVEQHYEGPWKNHILFDTVKTSKKKSGENKLEIMQRCLEEPECKGVTKTDNRWNLRKGRAVKGEYLISVKDGGPTYTKKVLGIKPPTKAPKTKKRAEKPPTPPPKSPSPSPPKTPRESPEAGNGATNSPPPNPSSEDIDKMTLEELKTYYNFHKDKLIKEDKKNIADKNAHFKFSSERDNNDKLEKQLKECLKTELCTGITQRKMKKTVKNSIRVGITCKPSEFEDSYIKKTKKTIMRGCK